MFNFLRSAPRDPERNAPAAIEPAHIAALIESEGVFDAPAAWQPRTVISERDLASLPAYASHGEIPALKEKLPLLRQNEIDPARRYAAFRLKDCIDSPAILDLLFDRNLSQIAQHYLEEQFHIAGITLWKSFANEARLRRSAIPPRSHAK